jgi:hypothetical protein
MLDHQYNVHAGNPERPYNSTSGQIGLHHVIIVMRSPSEDKPLSELVDVVRRDFHNSSMLVLGNGMSTAPHVEFGHVVVSAANANEAMQNAQRSIKEDSVLSKNSPSPERDVKIHRGLIGDQTLEPFCIDPQISPELSDHCLVISGVGKEGLASAAAYAKAITMALKSFKGASGDKPKENGEVHFHNHGTVNRQVIGDHIINGNLIIM